MTAAEDMGCKYSCCEVEVFMNFPLRETNSVVRETMCAACKILLGNPGNLDDFYWGLITGSLVPLGIKLHTVGDFMEIS